MKGDCVTHDWEVYRQECRVDSQIFSETFYRFVYTQGREAALDLAHEEIRKHREKNPFPIYEDIPQDVKRAVNGGMVHQKHLGGGRPVSASIIPTVRKRFKTPFQQRVHP